MNLFFIASPLRRRTLFAACSLWLLAACGSDSSEHADPALDSPAWQDCLASGKVLAHGAAGSSVKSAGRAPRVCARAGSAQATDPTQVVTESGALLIAPVGGDGVSRSVDGGRTFSTPLAGSPGSEAQWLHPWLYRDAESHRLFFHAYHLSGGSCGDGTGSNLWLSDDEGATWREIAGGVGCDTYDWGKLITGPARTDASKAALTANHFPNLVYFCAGGGALIIGPKRFCFRSTDGGQTFVRTKGNPIDPPSIGLLGYPNAGVIAPDGTFYMAHQSPTGLQLAVSEDEGDSWRDVAVAGPHLTNTLSLNYLTSNVVTDANGTLYLSWVDDTDLLPYLMYSNDRGGSWSQPVAIATADVHAAACLSLAVDAPGVVALSYFGSAQADAPAGSGYSTSDQRPYSSYLTVSSDLFASSPVFWTAQVNAPETPSFVGMTFHVSEYLGPPAFASDGTVWASFIDNGASVVAHLSALPTANVSP